jgi:ATP-binding cassette subfamily C (CFTR/MRP) protein 1
MMFLPRALSAISDARSGLGRLRQVFNAETRLGNSLHVDEDLKWALQVEGATFEWEKSSSTKADGTEMQPNLNAAPFRVQDITMLIRRGMLVAIVGRIGSGKSSLLMALIGEMRKVKGSVTFGGRVAYCSQTAWIQNATLVFVILQSTMRFISDKYKRENILFGQEFNEEKYWRVIEQASLLQDLELLPDGDLTEVLPQTFKFSKVSFLTVRHRLAKRV